MLQSIIFLFIKHPFDVGDRVVINKETYTVKEIYLLSTTFLDGNSTYIQAPNNVLNGLVSLPVHSYKLAVCFFCFTDVTVLNF